MQEKAFMIEMEAHNPQMRQVQYTSLELPASDHEIRDALHKLRATREMLAPQEYYIYNCEIFPQLNEVRLDTATLDELNFFAKRLVGLDQDERNILQGIATKFLPTDEDELVSIRDLINMTYGTGVVSVISNVTNDEQLGEFVIETELQDEIALVPKKAIHLLDAEKIGRIQRAADGGVYVGNLYVCADHFEMPKVYDGITLPEAEPVEWYAFRLQIAQPTESNGTSADFTEWITLPLTRINIDSFPMQHNGLKIEDCTLRGFESSVPQITEDCFTSMEDFEQLNKLAWQLTLLAPEEQVKFKAVLEAERPFGLTLADMEDIACNLDKYEMSTVSDSPGAFFKEYLLKHLDTRFDPQWLDNIVSTREGNKLLDRLGATMTDYGVISARDRSLFQLVPVDQEQTGQEETPVEDQDEGEGMVMKM